MVLAAFVALVALVSLVSASNGTGIAINPQILAQVQMEDSMARFYVDFSLKIRNAMLSMQASQLFSQVLMLELKERQAASARLEEDDEDEDDKDFDLEENETLYGETSLSDKTQTAIQMEGYFQFYSALKLKFYQSVIKAREIQANFWMDRYIQETLMMSGVAQNPQIYQFMYFKMFRTNLETIKLALTFQYYSDFSSWFEDEFDVGVPVVSSGDASAVQKLTEEQTPDIIGDKIAAFSKFSSVATLELFTFYLDMYFGFAQQQQQQASNGTAAASSFIEEEMEAEPAQPTESKFLPMMMASQNPMMFMVYFKLYFLMVQYSAARAGVTSSYAEKLSYEISKGHIQGRKPEEAKNYKTFAQNMFGGEFASNLYTSSMIKYTMTLYEFYMMMMMSYAQQQPQQQQQTKP